jgi:uncharacterized membrane protein YdbT with pleckstrin-like domain
MKSLFSIFKQSTNSFEGEENGERVVLLLRRHPFFILSRLALFVVLAMVPLIVGAIFFPFLSSNNVLDVFLFICGAWYLFIWSAIFYALTMYTLDVWVVTDRRIIDSTQNGFFNRTTSELHLARIQDISVQVQGVVQTFLHFGDLQVQTAGAEEKFKFSQIPNPGKVKDEIMKLASVHSPVRV